MVTWGRLLGDLFSGSPCWRTRLAPAPRPRRLAYRIRLRRSAKLCLSFLRANKSFIRCLREGPAMLGSPQRLYALDTSLPMKFGLFGPAQQATRNLMEGLVVPQQRGYQQQLGRRVAPSCSAQ